MGSFANGTKGFGKVNVNGLNLVPNPNKFCLVLLIESRFELASNKN